jgi:hypothetical protein
MLSSDLPMRGRVGPGRRIVHGLLITLFLGYLLVRYAIRQYVRKEMAWLVEPATVIVN